MSKKILILLFNISIVIAMLIFMWYIIPHIFEMSINTLIHIL